MAGLLPFYMQQKLLREKEELTYRLAQTDSKVSRIEDNITKVQKRYESMLTLVDKQAEMMKKQANMYFQQMSGIGYGQVSQYDYSGMTAFVQARTANLCKTGAPKIVDGKETGETITISDDSTIKTLMQQYIQNGGPLHEIGEDKKPIENKYQSCTADQAQLFMNAVNTARQEQAMRQQQVQTLNTQYDNNISIWIDAEKAKIENEQALALKPLEYEGTMTKLDKTNLEHKLKRVEAQYESYQKLAEKDAQDVPKFGLG